MGSIKHILHLQRHSCTIQQPAIDFNQSQDLEQAKTKDVVNCAKAYFFKMTKTWAVKLIKEVKDLVFFSSLVDQTVEVVLKKEAFDCSHKNISKNVAPIPKSNKIDAIANHRSRFSV